MTWDQRDTNGSLVPHDLEVCQEALLHVNRNGLRDGSHRKLAINRFYPAGGDTDKCPTNGHAASATTRIQVPASLTAVLFRMPVITVAS
jgi:hypothetical protein